MARETSQIQAQILDSVAADPTLSTSLTSTSKRAIYRLWSFITAVAINMLEQLIDVLKADIEATAAATPPANALWLQKQMFAFQYDATNPQVIQLIDGYPQYPVVDSSLQIITACSVTSTTPNVVAVKLATGNPFQALDASQQAAAQSYINYLGVVGISYNIISLPADKLYLNANVYYSGQYSAVIKANVINVVNNYLQKLSKVNFDGSIKMSDLEGVIRNVPGVTDVVLLNVRGRADSDVYSAGIDLILNTAILQKQWKTIAGYIVGENTAGKTFNDTLNFISQ